MEPLLVRRLTAADAEAYCDLRRESLLEAPLALTASPSSDQFSSPASVREHLAQGDGSAIFGAFAEGLVGAAGLSRPHHPKTRHKLTLWGMYVSPAARGRGVAAALLEAAIAHARALGDVAWIQLAVGLPDARRLYERFGFRPWGTEPDALRHDGRSIDESHMALLL